MIDTPSLRSRMAGKLIDELIGLYLNPDSTDKVLRPP
jgi:hypothetical protein